MKNETKFKIINWVKKLLKYHEPINPIIIREHERKIKEIEWEGDLEEYDANHNYKELASYAIARELHKLNAISFEKEKLDAGHLINTPLSYERYKVRAKLLYIDPIKK